MSFLLLVVYAVSFLLALGYVLPLTYFGLGIRAALKSTAGAGHTSRRRLSDPVARPFVSVVIAARNEEAFLEACLESLIDSTYPSDRFEIIVVDDNSEDGTYEVVESFSKRCESPLSIRALAMPGKENRSRARVGGHKKQALDYGISESRGSIIALTDADCRVPREWLDLVVETFDDDTGFVAGPVVFPYGDSAFSRSVALEFMGLAGIHAGSIHAGRPVSCSGGNVAFRRAAFDEVGGYSGLEHLSSGDDEFLMLRIESHSSWDVRYCACEGAIVVTRAPETVRSFLRQRKRWASKVGFYEDRLISVMHVAVYLFVLSIPLVTLAAMWDSRFWPILFFMLCAKIGAERWVLSAATRLFDGRSLLKYHLPAQPFQIAYVLWAGMAGLLGRYVWKSRTLER